MTNTQRLVLEGFRNGDTYCFRMRCRALLLKSKGFSINDIADITGLSFEEIEAL